MYGRWPTGRRNRDTSQQVSDADTDTTWPSLSGQGSKGGSTTDSSFTQQAGTDLEDTAVESSQEIQAANDAGATAASRPSSPAAQASPTISSGTQPANTNMEGASRKPSAESYEFETGATGASRFGSPASALSIESVFGIAGK